MDDAEKIEVAHSIKKAPVQTLGELSELVAQGIEWQKPPSRLGGCTRYNMPERDPVALDLAG